MSELAPVLRAVRGLAPSMAALVKGTYNTPDQRQTLRHSRGTAPHLSIQSLHAGLLPFHSQLLRESLLLYFPPLIYMLKFSG